MKWPVWLGRLAARAYDWAEAHQGLGWALPFILATFTFAYLYTEEPFLEYKNLPFPVSAPYVRAGAQLVVTVSRCNRSRHAQTYLITRTLENLDTHAQYILPDTITKAEPGCEISANVLDQVPTSVPPGQYRILGISQIQSEFRVVYVPWESQAFHITQGGM